MYKIKNYNQLKILVEDSSRYNDYIHMINKKYNRKVPKYEISICLFVSIFTVLNERSI